MGMGIHPLLIYSLILYFLLKKYVKDVQNKYHRLLLATSAIAKGDLDIALSGISGSSKAIKTSCARFRRFQKSGG